MKLPSFLRPHWQPPPPLPSSQLPAKTKRTERNSMRGRPCHCIVEYPPFVRQGRIVDCDSIVEKSTNHVLRYIYIYISSSSFLIHQINFLPIFLFRLFDYCLLVQGYSLLRIVIMECKSDQAKRRWLLRKSGERMDDTSSSFG